MVQCLPESDMFSLKKNNWFGRGVVKFQNSTHICLQRGGIKTS